MEHATMPTTDHSSFRQSLLSGVIFAAGALGLAGCVTPTMLRERGEAALAQGDAAAANEYLSESVSRNPTSHRAQYSLGVSYLRMGDPVNAQLAFERALTLVPSNSSLLDPILDGLAESMFQQERFDALAEFLERTASFHGRSRDYLRQADYMARAGDLDAALVGHQKAIQFAPENDPRPYLAIADFYESLNDVPRAIESLRYALYIAPEDPDIANRLRRLGMVPGPTIALEPPRAEQPR